MKWEVSSEPEGPKPEAPERPCVQVLGEEQLAAHQLGDQMVSPRTLFWVQKELGVWEGSRQPHSAKCNTKNELRGLS